MISVFTSFWHQLKRSFPTDTHFISYNTSLNKYNLIRNRYKMAWKNCVTKCIISRVLCLTVFPPHLQESIHFTAYFTVCSRTFRKCYHIVFFLETWAYASETCIKRRQTLVSVHSQEEMNFINYLLRDVRYHTFYGNVEGHAYDTSYSAHIGEFPYRGLNSKLVISFFI